MFLMGQSFSYEIIVRNGGNSPAFQVRVEEELPAGVKYLGGDPLGEIVGDRIVWMLGVLEIGAEKRVRIDVRPNGEGELQTRAIVTSSTKTGLRTRVTRPKVTAQITGPTNASVGETLVYQIALTNSGTATAHRISLRADLTNGLRHSQGQVIEAELAGIPAGETKTVSLKTIAVRAGSQEVTLTLSSELGTEAKANAQVQIIEPSLKLTQTGPTRAFVNAQPTYTIELQNPSSATSQAVQLMSSLPEGFTFIAADNGGTFDEQKRLITWNFTGINAGATQTMTIKTKATTAGEWIVRSMTQTGPRFDAKAETAVSIEGIPALSFELVDLIDPVPLSKEATYEIRVLNQGTCPCTNIRLTGVMSEGMQLVGVTGPVTHKVTGQLVVFEPLGKLAVKADAVIRVRVKGTQATDQRFQVQLNCTEIPRPIVKEESTRFYSE